MPLVSELLGLARFATGLRASLKTTVAPDAARRLVREWVGERDARFLRTVERAVFGRRRGPYRALFDHAGCALADVAALVRQHGLEPALERLAGAGVYVTWEEFKGRVPAVRGSRTFQFKESDFDNPLITTHYRVTSGGTTGGPVRVRVDLEEHAQAAPDWAVLFDAHGWLGRPLVFWAPSHTGLANRYLRCAKFGMPYTKWFTMAGMATPQDRIRSAAVHGVARRIAGLPRPEPARLDQPQRVGSYLLELLAQGRKPVVNTSPSAAARLAIEMGRGRALAGVTFLLGAEPLTPARRSTIEASGASVVPTYGTSECGWIGAQFPGATVADEVQVFRDAYAVIGRGADDGPDGPAQPLLFTNLRPAAPKVLINAEIGDSAVIVDDETGRYAGELGYTRRLHTIRSFRKFTAWGTTFAQADLYHVLEEALPRRFGGSLADYQLVERVDERGLCYITLRASPAVGACTDEALRSALLSELGRLRGYYGLMTTVIAQADAVKVERRSPVPTSRGKVLPVLTELQ
jgi:hypothetical protein